MKKILLTLTMLLTIFSCGGNSKEEKKLVLNMNEEGQTMDSSLTSDNVFSTILGFVNEGIKRVGKDGKFENGLAKEVSTKDGVTYKIVLKDGLKWSNGDPITVDDFIYSWTRALDPKTASSYAYILYPIKNAEKFNSGKAKASDLGLKKVNDKEFIVTLEQITPYFEQLLGFSTYLPLNEKFVKEQGEEYALEPENMLYSGPFKLDTWTHGTEMVFSRNENYHDAKNVNLDKVVVKFIPDNAASLNAFKNGETDVHQLSTEQFNAEFKKATNIVINPEATVFYLQINTSKNSVLNNKNIRKAIALSIDNDTRLNKVFESITSKVIYTFTPAGVGIIGDDKDFIEELYEKGFKPNKVNVEEAKKYLAKGLKELGLKKLPEISIIVNDSGTNRKTIEYIQDELRRNLGISVKVELMTFKERIARMHANNFDIVFAGWGADYLDPINFLELLYTSNGNNYGKFNNKKYDELIEKAGKETDKHKRMEYLREAERMVADEAPIIPLVQTQRYYVYNPKVKNLIIPGFGNRYVINYVDIEK